MSSRILSLMILSLISLSLSPFQTEARKIKQSLKVITESSDKKNGRRDKGVRVFVNDEDTIRFNVKGKDHELVTRQISFTGYDKNINSSKESFHVVNNSGFRITGMQLQIIYEDMEGRMLHSRKVSIKCDIPHAETRKTDIATWDTQHSFYYYLSNEPQKVSSPYQVKIIPLSFTIGNY